MDLIGKLGSEGQASDIRYLKPIYNKEISVE